MKVPLYMGGNLSIILYGRMTPPVFDFVWLWDENRTVLRLNAWKLYPALLVAIPDGPPPGISFKEWKKIVDRPYTFEFAGIEF